MISQATHKISKKQAWFLAARPKTLVLVIVPILTGTALGLRFTQHASWFLLFSALCCGVFIQIAVNLINDALDFKKGADQADRLGPERMTQQGFLTYREVLYGGYGCIVAAFICGLPLMIYEGPYFFLLIAIAGMLAYGYTGGPFPLAYYGLGELFVIIFFGIIGTLVGFYLQTQSLMISAVLAGFQIGLLAAAVNAINNLRDIEGDARVNKKTMAVRFGATFARFEITLLILLPYFLNLLWSDQGFYKAGIFPLVTMPLGFTLVRCIWYYEPSKIYNTFLGMAALLNLLFGLFLSIGFWL